MSGACARRRPVVSPSPISEVRGLSIRVTANGVKSWQIRYRPKGKSQRYEIPGRFDPHSPEALSLATARQRARDIVAAAKKGIDLPEHERRERAKVETVQPVTRTMTELATDYVNKHCKLHQRRWRDTDLRLRNHVLPTLGNRPVASIRKGDMVDLLDEIEHVKGMRQQVNRTRTTLSAMFEFAIEREHEYGVSENPVAGIRRRKVEGERSRVLSNEELRAIWRTLETMDDPGRSFVQLLMLTGVRRDEARGLRWNEIDFHSGLWILPGARTRAARISKYLCRTKH